jgi:protein ImuB
MFAVIYIPNFSLQAALRFDREIQIAALVDPAIPKSPIVQITEAASEFGVVEGMSPTQALARCANLVIKTCSLAQEKSATDALLRCTLSFSPDVELTAEGVVTLDLKGFKNLAPEKTAQNMIGQVALLNLDARVGVAENPLLAFYAAQFARPIFVVADSKTFLNALPIETIEPTPETLAILKTWGIHTLGSFLALGREPLAARIGAEAVELFDRASADAARPLRLIQPPETFEESVEFEHEIETAEPLLFVLRRFVEQIVLQMQMTGRVAEELALRLKFSAGPDYEHVFKIPSPTSDDATLFRMLHTHLENFKTAHPIVALSLSGKPCIAKSRQFGLFETSLHDPNRFAETLARVAAIVGSERVGTPMAEATNRPDGFRMTRFAECGVPAPRSEHQMSKSAELELRAPTGLPLRRFRPPMPVRVELNESIPNYLRSQKFSGAIRDVRGPWRSSGDWWREQIWSRDEWDVQLADGNLYRLFQQGGDWFIEGIYD